MEDLKLSAEKVIEIIQANFPKMIQDALVDKYDSPIKKAIEEEVKGKEGEIRILVKETLATVLTDTKFRDRLAQEVIAVVLQKGLSR